MVAVNDVPVNWENLEPVCNKLSSKVVSKVNNVEY